MGEGKSCGKEKGRRGYKEEEASREKGRRSIEEKRI